MADREREEHIPDPTTKHKWRITLRQLNRLVDGLENYDQLFRIRNNPDETSLPPECVVYYIESLEEYPLSIMVEQTARKGKYTLIASRGVLPIIRDIFGHKFPVGEEL